MAPDARKRVRIARQELRAVRNDVENAGSGRLLLNVADGAHFDVVVEQTASTKFGYSLSGRVAGDAGGFVTLVVHEEAVAGSIWTPNAEYELSYLGGGVHALKDVTNAPPFECGGGLPSEMSTADAPAQGDTDDGSVVDILVVWTTDAEEEHGGSRPQVLSVVDLLIAYINNAFERSGAVVSLNLVGAEKVDYTEAANESDSGRWFLDARTDLYRLEDPGDGYMDGVHDQRDALGADLVYLLTARGGGLGQQNWAFATGNGSTRVFAHEIGHNMNLRHDRLADANTGHFSNGFTTEHCFGTIMSYGSSCGRHRAQTLPFYASPWRYDPVHGVPLGVTRFANDWGASGPANAVLELNRNRRAANHRPSRGRE